MPIRIAKIAAAKRGMPRLRHVIEAMRKANTGRPRTAEHRARMSAAQRRRRTRPPAAGRPWTAAELAAMGTMLDRDHAERFGRCATAVALKRKKIGIVASARRRAGAKA
jgi:hypothetical protein